jgi:hypothetical protein
MMEESPNLLTDPLEKNDSKSSLTHSRFSLHKMRKQNLSEAQREVNRFRERERKKSLSKNQENN